MVKLKKNKAGHPNFLHLNEVLHHMEDGVVNAYDWLAGPVLLYTSDAAVVEACRDVAQRHIM